MRMSTRIYLRIPSYERAGRIKAIEALTGAGMNEAEKLNQISQELWDKVRYITNEYDVTTAMMIGILEIMKHELIRQAEDGDNNE
jgi:hypothetical protein